MGALNNKLIPEIYPLINNLDEEAKIQGLLNAILIRTNFLTVKRQQLGWNGLKYSCRNGESWTCRIAGMDGVYGLAPGLEHDEYGYYLASWDLYYFPAVEDRYFENYALETETMICDDNYLIMQRDFQCYSKFKARFKIGQISLEVSKNLDNVVLTQHAPVRIQSISEKGVKAQVDGENVDIIEEGGIDQDLPAFEISTSFFNVLGETLSYNLQAPPSRSDEYIFTFSATSTGKANRLCFGEGWQHDVFMAERGAAYKLARSLHDEHTGTGENIDNTWWKTTKHDLNKIVNDERKNKPELIILSGYLGAGKTTFIKNLIEYHVANRRFVAVIQNEIGKTGLDARLLEDEYAVLEMDEGCVCCSLVGQLKKGIRQVTEDHNPEVIILETTGLANPFNLLEEIDELSDIVSLGPLTTIIDAGNFRYTAQISPLVLQQLLAANVVVINKADLVKPGEMDLLKDELTRLNPKAIIFTCTHGNVNAGLIYGKGVAKAENNVAKSTHKHHHDHRDENNSSVKLEMPARVKRKEFLEFITSIKELAYRIKGLVTLVDDDKEYVFQYVNGNYELLANEKNTSTENYLICIGKTGEISQINHIFLNYKKQLS